VPREGDRAAAVLAAALYIYGMASYRALPDFLGRISPQFSTPVVASILVGLIFVAIIWVYLLSVGAANVFDNLISLTGIVYAAFYARTALCHRVLPAPRLQQLVGRAARRHPPVPRCRVPGPDDRAGAGASIPASSQ
jgi:amino acid transporter